MFFSVIFTKGNNFRDFLFAYLAYIDLPNWGFLLLEGEANSIL